MKKKIVSLLLTLTMAAADFRLRQQLLIRHSQHRLRRTDC